MKIKRDKNYEILKSEVSSFPELIESKIIEHCLNIGIIDGEPECFGITLGQAALDFDENSEQLYLSSLGYSNFTFKGYSAFKKLIFVGDGDCPDCGGDLEDCNEGGSMYQHDYDSEPYLDGGVDFQKCNNCNETF